MGAVSFWNGLKASDESKALQRLKENNQLAFVEHKDMQVLNRALRMNKLKVAELLLQLNPALFYLRTRHNLTPFHVANSMSAIGLLEAHCIKNNINIEEQLLCKNKLRKLPIEFAMRAEKLDVVEWMVQMCSALNPFVDEWLFWVKMKHTNEEDCLQKLREHPNLAHVKLTPFTILHMALKQGKLKIAEHLLQVNPKIFHVRTRSKSSAFHYATASIDAFQFLLRHCAQHNIDVANELMCKNENNMFPIHFAIKEHKLEIVELMLQICPKLLQCHYFFHVSLLHVAVAYNDHETIPVICKLDPNLVFVQNRKYCTPILRACVRDYDKCFQQLFRIDATIPTNLQLLGSWIAIAVLHSAFKIVQFLLLNSPDAIRSLTQKGHNLLYCCRTKEMAQFLLSQNPSLMERTPDGRTLFEYAIFCQRWGLASFFLSKDTTFLYQNEKKAIQMLIKHLRRLNPKRKNTCSDFNVFVSDILKIDPTLLQYGGNSPLHVAARFCNDKNILQKLMSDFNCLSTNAHGNNPCDLALLWNNKEAQETFHSFSSFMP